MFNITPFSKKEYKEILSNSEAELSTLFLQLVSLNTFMNALGYAPSDWEHGALGEKGYNYTGLNEHLPKFLNFQKAVKLHNYGYFIKVFPIWEVPEPSRVYSATQVCILEQANRSKYVQAVFLVYSRKRKEFFTQKNKVKFVED